LSQMIKLKLADAELDVAATGSGDIEVGEISQSNNTLAIGVVAAGDGDIEIGEISQSNNTLAIGVVAAGSGDIEVGEISQSNNTLAIGAIEGAAISDININITITNSGDEIAVDVAGQDLVIGDINITNSGDEIAVDAAGQDLVIGDIALNFDDSGGHMEFIGFNGAGVDGGHVITFQGGANDVAVAEHDGHTTLSYDNLDLTVDAVGLVPQMDWYLI
jgi:hypothetical protein